VQQRLETELVSLRSVWFPTPKELREWEASSAGLYLRIGRKGERALGPRLASMWASAFAPTLSYRLVADGSHTAIQGVKRFAPITKLVLGTWWVVVIGWGIALTVQIGQGTTPPIAAGWWTILFLATTAGPLMGWVWGGAALEHGLHAFSDADSEMPKAG
jgi:hypothetical protein